MERSLIKQIGSDAIKARVTSRKVKPVYFPNFFRSVPVDILKWETLTGEKGVPVAADVISYDASAPEKTKDVISKMSGDIPKVGIKRSMNESEWIRYDNLMQKANGRPDMVQLLDLVFNDLDFVYNGVRARYEWLSMQQLSTGQLSLSKTNNAGGIVTEKVVDFGVPSENKAGFGTNAAWSDLANSKPIDDLEERFKFAKSKGVGIQYFIMRDEQWIQLKNSADTIAKMKAWLNTTAKFTTTLSAINAYLKENLMPVIVIIDPAVKLEAKDHTRTVVNPWELNRVALVPDLNVGTLQHGPIAAERSAEVKKKATLYKKDFILITKWSELEPFKEYTKAEANAMPVLDDPETIFYLRTDNATWS